MVAPLKMIPSVLHFSQFFFRGFLWNVAEVKRCLGDRINVGFRDHLLLDKFLRVRKIDFVYDLTTELCEGFGLGSDVLFSPERVYLLVSRINLATGDSGVAI